MIWHISNRSLKTCNAAWGIRKIDEQSHSLVAIEHTWHSRFQFTLILTQQISPPNCCLALLIQTSHALFLAMIYRRNFVKLLFLVIIRVSLCLRTVVLCTLVKNDHPFLVLRQRSSHVLWSLWFYSHHQVPKRTKPFPLKRRTVSRTIKT